MNRKKPVANRVTVASLNNRITTSVADQQSYQEVYEGKLEVDSYEEEMEGAHSSMVNGSEQPTEVYLMPYESSSELSLPEVVAHLKQEVNQLKNAHYDNVATINHLTGEVEKLRAIVERVIKSENEARKSRGTRPRKLPLCQMDPVSLHRINLWDGRRKRYIVRFWKENDVMKEEAREVEFDYASLMTAERFNGMEYPRAIMKYPKLVMDAVLRPEYLWQYSDAEAPRDYLRLPTGFIDDMALALYVACGGALINEKPTQPDKLSNIKENITVMIHDRLTRLHPKGRETISERAKKMQKRYGNKVVDSSKERKKESRKRKKQVSSSSSDSSSDSSSSSSSEEDARARRKAKKRRKKEKKREKEAKKEKKAKKKKKEVVEKSDSSESLSSDSDDDNAKS